MKITLQNLQLCVNELKLLCSTWPCGLALCSAWKSWPPFEIGADFPGRQSKYFSLPICVWPCLLQRQQPQY